MAVSILVLVVSLSIGRPTIGRWRIDHASAALLGAVLTLGVGLVPVGLAVQVLGLLFFPLLTIVSLMIITLVAEEAGLIGVATTYIARAAGGNARKLFTYLFVAGTLTGMVFTNDAAILIFTPLVFALIEDVQLDDWTPRSKVPYYFSVLYVGNLVGALVISNPINIIVTSVFRIGFLEYAAWMMLPAVISMVVSYAGLRITFRKVLPARYRLVNRPMFDLQDKPLAVACAVVLGLTLLGFFSESLTGIPVWAVALTGALTLLAAQRLRGRSAVPVLRGVGWDVIFFVVGIFIVAAGLRNAGLSQVIGAVIHEAWDADMMGLKFATGFVAAILSSILNNHPTAGLMTWLIQDLHLGDLENRMLVFAALIGGDLGPKMLPIGSLAALMWFRMLRTRGVEIPYALYIKIGIPVTLVAVFLCLCVLHLEWMLYRLFVP